MPENMMNDDEKYRNSEGPGFEKLTIPFIPKKMRGKVYWDQDAPPNPPPPRVISKKELEQLKKQAEPNKEFSIEGINNTAVRVMMIDGKWFGVTNQVLGEGAFGKVSVAQNLETGEWIADKKFKGERSKEKSKFKTKAELSYEREKDNLTKINNSLGQIDNQLELMMTFVSGHDLDQYAIEGEKRAIFRKTPPLTPQECYQMLKTALESLKIIHDAGYVHCDIKPANMMYDPMTGQLKIVDIGLMTAKGSKIMGGTKFFNAPEKTEGWKKNEGFKETTASDIYSFGFSMQEVFGFRNEEGRLLKKEKLPHQPIQDQQTREQIYDLLLSLTKNQPKDRLTLENALQRINDLCQIGLNVERPKKVLHLDVEDFKNLKDQAKKEHLDQMKAREFDEVVLCSGSGKIDFELCSNMLAFLKEDYGLPSVSQNVVHTIEKDLSQARLTERRQSLHEKGDMDMISIAQEGEAPKLVEDQNLAKDRLGIFMSSLEKERERLRRGASKLLAGKICSWLTSGQREKMAQHLIGVIERLDNTVRELKQQEKQGIYPEDYNSIVTKLVKPNMTLRAIRALTGTNSNLKSPTTAIKEEKDINSKSKNRIKK